MTLYCRYGERCSQVSQETVALSSSVDQSAVVVPRLTNGHCICLPSLCTQKTYNCDLNLQWPGSKAFFHGKNLSNRHQHEELAHWGTKPRSLL